MARPLRFEYPGAVYHVMARGDGGKTVFESDDDRRMFLARLKDVCTSHGWRIHAWVLMGNHFHLLLETPQANLVSGMKWLLGTFSQVWNRARKRRGHVFQGRYKSIPVSGTEADASYLRIVADYIHLNPARAGLVGQGKSSLADYRWSSVSAYAKKGAGSWVETTRVLRAFQLAEDGRGHRAYVAWLEARAANEGGKIDDVAMAAMRRGWYLGTDTFKDRLLKLAEKRVRSGAAGNHSGEAVRARDEKEAVRMIRDGCEALGLPRDSTSLAALRKGDARKITLAAFLKTHTTMPNAWIAGRLHMGHAASLSRLVSAFRAQAKSFKRLKKLEKMLNCKD